MQPVSSGIDATPRDERFGFACGLSASPVMTRAHRHDDVEMALALGGGFVMEHGGRPHVVEEGRCAVFWASVPHRVASTAGAAGTAGVQVAWVTVPLVEVLAWASLPGPFTAELLRGTMLTVAAPPNLAASMSTWAAEIGSDPTLTTAARREVEACLLRTSGTAARDGRAQETAPPQPSSRSEQLATGMAAWVSTHFREPVTVADVARSVHVHPSTATAAFRRHLGVSIGEYLAQCRTAEAQRLLISTDATTSDIALGAGFGSVSAFYERFVRDVGLAPAAYRRLVRSRLT